MKLTMLFCNSFNDLKCILDINNNIRVIKISDNAMIITFNELA